MTIVLMYHAIYRDEADLQRVDLEDRPYAVSVEAFKQQLKVLSAYRCGVLPESSELASQPAAVTNPPDIVITFDDGHASNYDIAWPLLREYGFPAYFFVTTDFIAQRDHFCDWNQLREMAEGGMIIGSHGITHQFFADMDQSDAVHEFSQSRQRLQEQLQRPALSISFPGGRYSIENLEQARTAGYRLIFGSGFGTLGSIEKQARRALNRIPIRSGTSIEQFEKIVSGDKRYYAIQHVKASSKAVLKKIIGNDRYHVLYKFAADRR